MFIVYLIPLVVLSLAIVCITETVSACSSKPTGIRWALYCILFGTSLFWVFNDGLFANPILPPKVKTVASLLEQAQGEKLYWNEFGERLTLLDRLTTSHFEKKYPRDAVRELGAMGKKAIAAEKPLIELLETASDFDTGDGVLSFRTDIVRSLAMIESAQAIPEIIQLLRDQGLPLNKDEIHQNSNWHKHGKDYYDAMQFGPSGIVHSLLFYPPEYNAEITRDLANVLTELESTPGASEWAIFAIRETIKYFDETDRESLETRSLLCQLINKRIYPENQTTQVK